MNDLPQTAIFPQAIAAKLAAAANLTAPEIARQIEQEPRLPELLWFLQWVSSQPGSIEKFALDLIAGATSCFGPAALHDDSAPIGLEEWMQIWESLPASARSQLIPPYTWTSNEYEDRRGRADVLFDSSYPSPQDDMERRRFQSSLLQVARQDMRDVFVDAARKSLAMRLRSMCGPVKHDDYPPPQDILAAPWYCPTLPAVLFEAMDLHASRIELRLAPTKVKEIVFDSLECAWSEKSFVKIDGETRTGKTEAVKAWCDMNPGKARLVSTPSGKSCGDLFKAMADAIGLPYGPTQSGTLMKEQIQYIIRHAGLFLIFDEAHFLIPASFNRNTPPARMDWLRTQIIDKDLPVALVTTPQAYTDALAKFQGCTHYNFAQFDGRVLKNVVLPNTLDNEDVLAVVKIQAQDIPENLHPKIAAAACQSAGYLHTVKAVCKLARHIAQRKGHRAITQANVEQAVSEVLPAAPVVPAPTAPPERRQPLAVKRSRAAAPIRAAAPAPALEMPAREISPSLQIA